MTLIKPPQQEVSRENMERIVTEHYGINFLDHFNNEKLKEKLYAVLDEWVETANWEDLETEHDYIVY